MKYVKWLKRTTVHIFSFLQIIHLAFGKLQQLGLKHMWNKKEKHA